MRIRFGKRSKQGTPAVLTETQVRRINLVFTAFAAIFVLVGGFFAVQGTLEWIRAADSTSWPTVAGTVTRSEVTSHRSSHKGRTSTSYHAHIEFDYRVDGQELHGNRRTYKVVASSQSAANEAVAAHPVDRVVTVSYDPQDPSRAVLDPGWDWSNAIPIGVGLFAMVFIGFIRWLVVKRLRRSQQAMRELCALGIDPATSDANAPQSSPTPEGSAPAPAASDPTRSAGPAELKPTFHDDLPGAR